MTRITIAVSLFFSVSSIASLSDLVFEWKNFFRVGIDFYRIHIIGYVFLVVENIGINIDPIYHDFVVISSIVFSAIARQAFIIGISFIETRRKIHSTGKLLSDFFSSKFGSMKLHHNDLIPQLKFLERFLLLEFLVSLSLMFFIPAFVIFVIYVQNETSKIVLLGSILFVYFILIAIVVSLQRILEQIFTPARGWKYVRESPTVQRGHLLTTFGYLGTRRRALFWYLGIPIASIFFVLVAAAINEGLSRVQ